MSAFVRHHNAGIYKKKSLYGQGQNIVGVADLYDIDRIDGQVFDRVQLSDEELSEYSLGRDDLVYGESSLVREGIARTVHVTERGAGTAFAWHTRRYAVDTKTVFPRYLYYFLQSQAARDYILSVCIQTALTGINTREYFSCPVGLPSLKEQRAIATALSDADALIESLDRLIDKKRAIKQAAMQQLLTGRTRLPGLEKKEGLQETNLGTIPRDWNVGQMGDFYDITSSKRVFQDEWTTRGIPFYRTREIAILADQNWVDNDLYISEDMYDEYARKYGVPKPGDALITGIGTIGKLYVVPKDSKFYFKDASVIWLKSRGFFCSDFLKYLFETPQIRQQLENSSTGTTVDTYTISGAHKTEIPVPRLEEQRAIVSVLSDMASEIGALERRRDKTKDIKEGMMQQLLTGRVRLVEPEIAA